ncbi:DNA cytosine methyltransferase (plasmid) [Entomospira entomophila]|uniref:Cytosine-specific methyltransferase n=1 Tax=Entomospira entomophila TaxID=2719988 RepID=A0A968GDQ1_9SPIO|nr:DNA cytosine methyltransferase [Entomospira entomophilus]NIZ41576.1 DNA cytosine methyltransferase [Entomospira entomophilus]WDI36477.1 DNA cytosine methyltransferase [Entomospira entomophilus]
MWTSIDLFAGIGGIRLGFEQAFKKNITCKFTSEIDKFAQKTYIANFGGYVSGDITTFPVENIPVHDILLAGFPCQAFSIAGHRKGFEDTRGTLFFDVARIISYHKTPIIFLENVKGLVNHNKGQTFKTITRVLEDLGYKIYSQILNAKNFGLPQNRERIYIIAFLDHQINFSFPESIQTPSKVGSILEHSVPSHYTISDKLWQGHQRRKLMHKKKGNGFGYNLFNHEDEYTSTLSARYYKDGSEILINQNNINPRKLTPREAARLQGFPDTYHFPVSDVQAYKQLGNSVAIPVITAIATQIYHALQERYSYEYKTN